MTLGGTWAFIKEMFLLLAGSIGWQGFLIILGVSALFAIISIILEIKVDKKYKKVGMTKIGEAVLHDGRSAIIIHCNYCKTVFVHIIKDQELDDNVICHGRHENPCHNKTKLSKLKENPYDEKIGPPWSMPC